MKKKNLLISRYSLREILLLRSIISQYDKILFMPEVSGVPGPKKYKKRLILRLLYLFDCKNIKEVDIDDVIGHFWLSNKEAAQLISSNRKEIASYPHALFINSMLDDDSASNYFLVTYCKDVFFEKLCQKVSQQHGADYFLFKIGKYNSDSSLIYDSKGFLNKILILPSYSLSNFSKTAFFSLMSFGVCIAFLLKSLRNGFKALPNIDKPLLCMPIIRGVSNESDMVSKTRGIKYSSDDRFIYGDEINVDDVIHVFDHWKFNKLVEKEFKSVMKDKGMNFIDVSELKLNLHTLKIAAKIIFKMILFQLRFFKKFNDEISVNMITHLPKGIFSILKKHQELQYVRPRVDLIRDDYNPASILRTSVSRMYGIRTLGIQHTGTVYDVPQLCFVNFDKYILFGDLYKKTFEKFLLDTEIIVSGKDFLDPVVDMLSDDLSTQALIKRFQSLFNDSKENILIILPGSSHLIRKFMRQKMINAIMNWSNHTNNSDRNLIIRFREKANIHEIQEWREVYNSLKDNKSVIIDFDEFTTQELMYISDLVIVPHSSYAMTEAMALNKSTFSFDFSGSAKFTFKEYNGEDFILENEEDLETIFTSERLVKNCDSKKYQNLKSGLDKYYDGKNIERIRQTITKLAES